MAYIPERLARSKAGSSLIRALEIAWDAIRDRHYEIPAVLVTTGQGLRRSGDVMWGAYGHDVWDRRANDDCPAGCKAHTWHAPDAFVKLPCTGSAMSDLFISGERLAAGAHAVMTTMLHEGAHALSCARDIEDARGEYHNRHFLIHAKEMGMEHPWPRDKQAGYSEVAMLPTTLHSYQPVIRALDRRIKVMMSTLAQVDCIIQSRDAEPPAA